MAEKPELEPDVSPIEPSKLLLVGVEPFARELERQAALLDWPALTTTGLDESLAALGELGPGDAVIVMEHQHKIANPVLVAALQSEVGYVGALGSRRMQAARVRLLQEAGSPTTRSRRSTARPASIWARARRRRARCRSSPRSSRPDPAVTRSRYAPAPTRSARCRSAAPW